MPDLKRCVECGTVLPAHWPKSLCIQCALDGALELTHAESQVRQERGEESASRVGPLQEQPETPAPLGAFGDYELLEEIARGGMGVVYKARQRSLNRIVAVKMILAGPHAGKEFVQRFRSEAAAAAILQHPHIVAIHEVGMHGGRHYFSMDYVEGQDLSALVGQQPLPADKAARYVEQIAEATHYAHERGILHRDLKPSNVLVDAASDQPRITDFGLAKRLDGESSLTITGQVLGSPNFMPPEQAGASRSKVGRASDVYALGGILYYLLTARAPFQADSLERLLAQVLHAEPVSPRLLNPSVPRDLETIVLKCLEKEPSRRYETAGEVAGELGRVRQGSPIKASPITAPERVWRWCRREPLAASGIVMAFAALLTGLAMTTWQWRRAEQERHAAQHEAYVAQINLAQSAWEQNHIGRVRQCLNETANAPQRGFEWGYWQRQTHLELMILRGHRESILTAASSPDGQRLLTGSADGTACLWDFRTGRLLFSLTNHTAPVSSAAFSKDGQRIVTGSWDGTAIVWTASNGTKLVTIKGHSAQLSAAAFSSDGQRILTASFDKTARLWDASTGMGGRIFEGHTSPLSSAALSPDGRWLATGSWDGSVRMWDATTGQELPSLIGHRGGVLALTFSPDGRRIVTGSQDREARIWDAATGLELDRLQGHSGPVSSVAFSPDGNRIATAGDDQTARIWEAGDGHALLDLKRHGSQISTVLFAPDDQRIVTAGGSINSEVTLTSINVGNGDATARIWAATPDHETLTLRGHSNWVQSAAFSPDGQHILTSGRDRTARLWESSTGKLVRILEGHKADVRAVAFSPDGQRIVTASWDATAKVWDAPTGRELFALVGHRSDIMSVTFSPDGQRIATGDRFQSQAKLWDAATGRELLTLNGHKGKEGREGHIWTVAFSPDSRRIATGDYGEDRQATIWDAATGQALGRLTGHASYVISIAFSPDGQRVLTGSRDETAKVWDAATGACLLTLGGHKDQVLSVTFSPDGQRILTGSRDHTARLWDAATGKELLAFKGHDHWVFSAVFSSDGLKIATASGDSTVKVWQSAAPDQIARWRAEASPDRP